LFQLFNYKDALPAVLDGFDKTQANATKTVNTFDMLIALSAPRARMDRELRAKRGVVAILMCWTPGAQSGIDVVWL